MKYSNDQFYWDVINEAIALRKHATKKERNNLSFDILNPMNQYRCVYGQLTGDCFSERAAELIELCCTRYMNKDAVKYGNEIRNVIIQASKTRVSNFKEFRTGPYSNKHYSALEAYITLPEAKNYNLIKFIRGESDQLDIFTF